MKAIIFHGTECKPEEFWYSWLKSKLEAKGFEVEVPYFPTINRESAEETLQKVLAEHTIDSDTVLVGHSSGVPLILSLLESTNTTASLAVLVAGFSYPISGNGEPDQILQSSYDWPKIKSQAKEFIIINSDNDPWGCDDKQGRKMYDELGGMQIIKHDGHFGSQSMNQPYKEFPLLDQLIPGADR